MLVVSRGHRIYERMREREVRSDSTVVREATQKPLWCFMGNARLDCLEGQEGTPTARLLRDGIYRGRG